MYVCMCVCVWMFGWIALIKHMEVSKMDEGFPNKISAGNDVLLQDLSYVSPVVSKNCIQS